MRVYNNILIVIYKNKNNLKLKIAVICVSEICLKRVNSE